MECFATAAFGLEGLVKRELVRLGKNASCENGGVRFEADMPGVFEANLWLRTADRVLIIVGEQKVETFDELFQFVLSLPWESYMPKDASFPVTGKCARSQLMSVRDCQAITKKAIVERFKRKYKQTWCPESGPEFKVDVSIHENTARLTIDTSGVALNRRGYRTWNGEAPLRETLAAALVMLSPLKDGQMLFDPCCGTGTLLIEAAFLRANRAPGLKREFACEKWPTGCDKAFDRIRNEAKAAFHPEAIGAISGSDIDPEALKLAKRHIQQADLGGKISVSLCDLRNQTLETKAPLFLMNPPYGERMSDRKKCELLYRDIRQLRDRHPDSRLCVITAHQGFERCFGQKATQKRRLYNGRLECEYLIY